MASASTQPTRRTAKQVGTGPAIARTGAEYGGGLAVEGAASGVVAVGRPARRLGDVFAWPFRLIAALAIWWPRYDRVRRTLRALRAERPPIDTGFDPATALTPAKLAALAEKATAYDEHTATSHTPGLLAAKEAYRDVVSDEVVAYGGLADAAYHSGQWTTALAFRYGVTGEDDHLAALERALLGLHHLMALAGGGALRHPRTGAPAPVRPGLPVRAYAHAGDARCLHAFHLDDPRVYVHEGPLAGVGEGPFLVLLDARRDQLDALLMGLASAQRVLRERGARPDLQRRIAADVGAFARRFVADGEATRELTCDPVRRGVRGGAWNSAAILGPLSWLKTAAVATGDRALERAYRARAERHVLGVKGRLRRVLENAVLAPLGDRHRELVGYIVDDRVWSGLYLRLAPLIEQESDPWLRERYVEFLEKVVRPLTAEFRVPFFDYVHLRAIRRRDTFLEQRAAAVLQQFPGPLSRRGSPPPADMGGETSLRDPLLVLARDAWARAFRELFGGGASPFERGGAVWPLGPGLAPLGNNIEHSYPYSLRGCGGSREDGTIVEYAGHDYLLSYWTGRYWGLL